VSEPALAILCDLLVPGDADWPAASVAIGDLDAAVEALPAADRAWLDSHAAAVACLPIEDRVPLLQRLEASEPEPFGRVLQALYDAYYSTEGAQAQVRRLAELGPREESPFFDERLLDKVIATQAGKRRL
jgi:hypothetical protein